MVNYAPRLSMDYSDVSGVIEEWATSCEKMVVYQHSADKEVSRNHLHMVMINCKYKTPEPLKRQFYSRVSTERKGNDLWSWVHDKYPNPDLSFITYMSEGNLRPVFVKNVLPAEVEEYRSKWIETTPKGSLLTERKESKKSKYELLQEMLIEVEKIKSVDGSSILNEIVEIVFAVLRKNKIVVGKFKIRDYRDSIMMYKKDYNWLLLSLVNGDYKS